MIMRKVLLFLFVVIVFGSCSDTDELFEQKHMKSSIEVVSGKASNSELSASLEGDVIINADSLLLETGMERSMIMTRATSPVYTWTTDVKVSIMKNVKVVFGPKYKSYLYPAVYICNFYTITTVTNKNPNRIYFSVNDDDCGFKPTATSQDDIVRGTRAYDNGDGTYTLKTVCYKILSNLEGVAPAGSGYIPCDPYKALLKYKYFDMPTEMNIQ